MKGMKKMEDFVKKGNGEFLSEKRVEEKTLSSEGERERERERDIGERGSFL